MTKNSGPIRRFLQWCWADISSGETIDLWLLVAASLLFTLLGVTGIASVSLLSSVVLALLALLAVSQIRGRQEVRSLVSSWHRSRTTVFEANFPDRYYDARSKATHSYSFSGMTMQRTLPTMRSDLARILDNGGRVRILLPDPDNDMLMRMVAASRRYGESAEDVSSTIRQSINSAKSVRGSTRGRAEVRITSLLPRLSLNIIDVNQPDGLLMVQMYQIQPVAEPGPIFVLSPSDGQWFTHFRNEFDQLWDRGCPAGER